LKGGKRKEGREEGMQERVKGGRWLWVRHRGGVDSGDIKGEERGLAGRIQCMTNYREEEVGECGRVCA